jgi:hypothetical protein
LYRSHSPCPATAKYVIAFADFHDVLEVAGGDPVTGLVTTQVFFWNVELAGLEAAEEGEYAVLLRRAPHMKRMLRASDDTSPALYVFELKNEADAIEVAKEIAARTGYTVVVRNADGIKIETVAPVLQPHPGVVGDHCPLVSWDQEASSASATRHRSNNMTPPIPTLIEHPIIRLSTSNANDSTSFLVFEGAAHIHDARSVHESILAGIGGRQG